MSRVCIITNYKSTRNYGALLQAYALNYTISQYVDVCHTLDCNLDSVGGKKINKYLKKLKRGKIVKFFEEFRRDIKKKLVKKRVMCRKKALDPFRESIPHTSLYSIANVHTLTKEYDILICGSDQIWRPTYSGDLVDVYWLSTFDDKVIKASYAASIGIMNYPSHLLEDVKTKLLGFDKISVREEMAAQYLEEITGRKDIRTVIDPVFLLKCEEWNKIAECKEAEDKYILVYMIHGSKKLLKTIDNFAKEHNYRIHTFPYMAGMYKGYEQDFGDVQDFTSTPNEFLGLIKDAEMVFTDSFHATAFSIIFHKDFYVSAANELAIERIKNLLNRLNVLNRLIPAEGLNAGEYVIGANYDWESIERNINREREYGISYIQEILAMCDHK